ncbi:Fe-only nitrogenase accessory protein AnfO [Natranaerovirga hydrolytica]|uniref:Fe-only nitrogenase accessory protein AnfO n=1 Tax=Natranaerovirga hydrolytica TaxID=680378 RepID=A0A4R1N5A3_9FIRM|nr:Fe-only nitrogenase accessory protein AnfO [Natranaerovirga hydrolytica]TCK97783.1 Fe-only nitrogenase accessory protein AnfO [Natranaerovirga hydrolytica]
MKIAVFLSDKGHTIPFDKEGIVKIFEKNKHIWTVYKEIPFEVDKSKGIQGVRQQIKEIVNLLEKSHAVVAAKVTGLPYTILEMEGYNIWEIEGKPNEFLEYVLEEEQKESLKEKDGSKESVVISMPQKINTNGDYYINLKEEQEKNSAVTSKQLLLPFLKKAIFYQLEVICGHIPPWFEKEFESLGLDKEVEKINDNEYKVMITRKTFKN